MTLSKDGFFCFICFPYFPGPYLPIYLLQTRPNREAVRRFSFHHSLKYKVILCKDLPPHEDETNHLCVFALAFMTKTCNSYCSWLNLGFDLHKALPFPSPPLSYPLSNCRFIRLLSLRLSFAILCWGVSNCVLCIGIWQIWVGLNSSRIREMRLSTG